MFYYLRAKNVDLSKNMEQVITSTAIKYICLFLFIKLIEYKYFTPDFFNMFVYSLVTCDIIFSIMLHYKLYSKENAAVFWDDDVIDHDLDLSNYKNEYKMAREQIELNYKHGTNHKHINLNDEEFNVEHTENISDKFHTDDLEQAINRILSDSKKDISDVKINNVVIDKESISSISISTEESVKYIE